MLDARATSFPIMVLYPFLAQGRTVEGYPYAVAALYERDPNPEMFSDYPFGVYTDGLVIDVRLSEFLKSYCYDALAAGASIHVPGISDACGGIAGDPKEKDKSASDVAFQLSSGLRGFALPGLLSVIGDFSDQELEYIFNWVKIEFADKVVTQSKLMGLLEMLKKGLHTAMLVSDGSGGQQGCAAVITPQKESHYFLEEC